MNKFFTVFVLFAVAVCCSAQDQNEEDKEQQKEIGLLLGNENMFDEYCLKERAMIIKNLQDLAAKTSSEVFNSFFGAATEIADEVLAVEKKAVAEFAKEIAQPSEQAEEGPIPEEEIEALIKAGKNEIQSKEGVFGRFVTAFKSTIGQVLLRAADSAIFVRLAKARSAMSAANLKKGIVDTCNQVADFENKLEEDLTEAKDKLKTRYEAAEKQEFIDSVSLKTLRCYTTKYVMRVSAFCQLLVNGAPSFAKMLGISADFKLTQ